MVRFILLLITVLQLYSIQAQHASIQGQVISHTGEPLAFSTVAIAGRNLSTVADSTGFYTLDRVSPGTYTVQVSFIGFEDGQQTVKLEEGVKLQLDFALQPNANTVDEVVVTGTMKAVQRTESPVPVEVYAPTFLKKNPAPNIFEALQNVNGVRPQVNCNVCNTGDIHINGLEGPYTMVLIDGMPIVSSLATVYGLSGIPNSLIERVEIVKGPASSLYGSEAIGGLINIITKKPNQNLGLHVDLMGTSWQEWTGDISLQNKVGKASVLTGIHAYLYDNPIDYNKDNFTDVTLQKRLSVFQKWQFQRAHNRLFTLAGRYFWENRWGGEMDWQPVHKGGRDVYGETITTNRWEMMGQYQLPVDEKIMFSFSSTGHFQDSYYGDVPYLADQVIGFGQLVWDKQIGKHDLLLGSALRYTYYDDNTPATRRASDLENAPEKTWLPGIFAQDEIRFSKDKKLLLGLRYDYHSAHGSILTPRMAFKWSWGKNNILRLNTGTGFRVVNLFTEDHAALTGAREVVLANALKPERSYNLNLNYIKKWYAAAGHYLHLETSAFYTHFTNSILPDYESNPNQIIYDNLDGHAETKGLSLNLDAGLASGWNFLLGATLMDVSTVENGLRTRQILTEQFSGTWSISYRFQKWPLSVDYTGNVVGPMRLPLLGSLDPRPEESPWWSIQNIQLTYRTKKGIEIYGGVKNLLNWTPWKNLEHPMIARAFDPFDKQVVLDKTGNVVSTPENPFALTFDPTYVYAPNQGIRGFLGVRYTFRK